MIKQTHSIDGLMQKIAKNLVRDFQTTNNLFPNAVLFQQKIAENDIRGVREFDWQLDEQDDVYTYKQKYQMSSLFKRYRFEKDLYTDSDLVESSVKEFLDNQDRIRNIELDVLPAYLQNVLFTARGFCQEILGDYDVHEHHARCRFGKRASVGIPRNSACEGARYEVPISGSKAHISWHKTFCLFYDKPAKEYIQGLAGGDLNAAYQEVEHLTLTLVPKTFKAMRSIMPNTTVGSFYTDGLGKMLQLRLKRYGYDITNLQEVHRVLAREGSILGNLCTADQSLASDNITTSLVKRILPKSWFDALNLGRVGDVKLPDGRVVSMETFCTMGNGFTFPLQTLIFLVLLKAIDAVYTKGQSRVSVYGDDLIYSADMHPFVMTCFQRLGLKINASKTFSSGNFRESCGSDFFAGVDVRPFLPKNESGSLVGRKTYEVILYKYINGLLRRWDFDEIPSTILMLFDQLEEVSRGILRVPPTHPDTSGIRVDTPSCFSDLNYTWAPITYKNNMWRFFALMDSPSLRQETRHAPYLFQRLGFPSQDRNVLDPKEDPPLELFKLRKRARQPSNYRSKLTGRRLTCYETFIPSVERVLSFKRKPGFSAHWRP